MTHFCSSSLWRSTVVFAIVLLFAPRLFAQCNPDVTPPTVTCLTGFQVSLLPSTGQFILWTTDILGNVADDCCVGELKIKRANEGGCDGDTISDAFADNITLCCIDAGSGAFPVVLRAYDCAGNFSECTTNVQVNPFTDATPPIAVCDEFTTVALSADGTATVFAATFDDGSSDNCCLGDFKVRRLADGPCDSDGLPDSFGPSVTFCCAEIGSPFVVELQVNDCAGNSNLCLINVEIQDKTAPILQAPSHVTVNCENLDPTFEAYGTATVADNCCVDSVSVAVDYSQYDSLCSTGIITRIFTAYDCSGNVSQFSGNTIQTITINKTQNYFLRLPDDVIVTEIVGHQFGEPSFSNVDCELMGIAYTDEVFTNDPNADLRVKRTWTIINWCTYDPNLPLIQIPNPNPNATPNHPANFPGVVVSAAGSSAPWTPTVVKINASDPTATDYSTFWDANANGYQYVQNIKVIDTFFVTVQGKVFSDSTANCSYDDGENLLEAWTVKATGQTTGQVHEVLTDANGAYSVTFSGFDTTVVITLVSSANFGQDCQSEYTVQVGISETAIQDVPVHLEQRFNLLSVGVATSRLRRCAENNQYTVQACNLSGETVEGVYVDLDLDAYFSYTNSSIPGTLQTGNTYRFQVGSLQSGECQSFTVSFSISCDAQLGATHCVDAQIYPYDQIEDPNWSGANVEVSATCDGDSVRFAIANVGNASTELLDFVVVEDVVMRQEGSFQLNNGETMNLSFPANGSTWRLESEEEPFHPWGGPEAVAIEGCGGLNLTGLVNLFPLSNPNPFEASDCLENIGSYDPNDKQGIPLGYGSQHFIKANTDLEYLIRFQNTGTDTAFLVVIEDVLSTQLDPASVRVEVASHPMKFALLEGGVLRFTFEDILLPDSNVNAITSNGFVKFRVSQQPNLADGSLIENEAAIYFDGNAPVITNKTFHTVGDHFISVNTNELENDGLLSAYPNPASDAVFFELKEVNTATRFELTNSLGQQISTESFSGKQYRFDRKNLPAGIYYFQFQANNTQIASGKIVLK